MNVPEKIALVKKHSRCRLCLGKGCTLSHKFEDNTLDNCKRGQFMSVCGKPTLHGQSCVQLHHRSLHSDDGNLETAAGVSCHSKAGGTNDKEVLLLVQNVEVQSPSGNAANVNVAFDTQSQLHVITFSLAEKLKLKYKKVSLSLGVLGGKQTIQETRKYQVVVTDVDGKMHHLTCYGIDEITGDLPRLMLTDKEARRLHNHPSKELQMAMNWRPNGKIHLLIGMENAALQPTKIEPMVDDKLAIFRSAVKSTVPCPFILGGTVSTKNAYQNKSKMCHFIRATDFKESEDYGVSPLRSCKNCMQCKECSYGNSHMTYKEQKELERIQENLEYNEIEKQWIARYPLIEDPEEVAGTYNGAKKCLQSLEKRLEKAGLQKEYEGQINDFLSRNVIAKMTREEIANEKQAYFVPHNFVEKPGATTPLRIVTNSSFKSPKTQKSMNDILVKGPSSLNNLYHILLRFRSYEVGMTGDVNKMYHSVAICQEQLFWRRLLWRPFQFWNLSMEEHPPDQYHLKKITFGEKPAGTTSIAAMRMTADKYGTEKNFDAQRFVKENFYVDDGIGGAKNVPAAQELANEIEDLLKPGGFTLKKWIIGGQNEPLVDLGKNNKVLGVNWDPAQEQLIFQFKVNLSGKNRGKRVAADLTLETIESLDPSSLTRRILLRVTNSIFDPIGLLSPITILAKLWMKEVHKHPWDEKLTVEEGNKWIKLFKILAGINVKFDRSFWPPGGVHEKKISLVGFHDASKMAYAGAIYARVKMDEDHYYCTLLTSKTRVSPVEVVSVPRLELLSAVLVSNVMLSVVMALEYLQIENVFFIGDSTSTMGMIQGESSSLKEFTATRTATIKRNIVKIKESTEDTGKEDFLPDTVNGKLQWKHVPRKYNQQADILTKGTMDSKYLESTEWIHGPKYISQEVSSWPTTVLRKDEINKSTPQDEVKYKVHHSCLITQAQENENQMFLLAKKLSNYKRLINTTAYMFKWHSHRGRKKIPLEQKDIEKSKKFWENEVSKVSLEKFKNGHYKSLRAYEKNGQVFMSGRLSKDAIKIGFDVEEFQIWPANHPYTKLFLKNLHEKFGHCSADRILHFARCNGIWVANGMKPCRTIRNTCMVCKIRDKRRTEQLMCDVKDYRCTPSPVFQTTSLDLFGPLYIRDNIVRKKTRSHTVHKCWGIIYCCLSTGSISLDLTEDYSTDSVLASITRFISVRGQPSRFICDQGSQLKAAAKKSKGDEEVISPDWKMVAAGLPAIEWQFTPVQGHWHNGISESFIGKTQRYLEVTLKNEFLTFGGYLTVLKEVESLLNSRPLGEVLEDGSALTPNHLLLSGRATVDTPCPLHVQESTLTKRFVYQQKLVDQFWQKWYRAVFHHLIPSYKWRKVVQNLEVGDSVLIYKEGLGRGTYKLGVIAEVLPNKEGIVRRAIVEYMAGQARKTVERSQNDLVILVKRDYTNPGVGCDQHLG